MRFIGFVVMVLFSMTSQAITVGGLFSKSSYGEPLMFEIELYNLYDLDHEDIDVRVVPKSEHKIQSTSEDKIGPVSIGLYTSNGIGWISFTSPVIVHGGTLDIVVEIQWPGGKSFRRYKTDFIGKSNKTPDSDAICPSSGRWIKCM